VTAFALAFSAVQISMVDRGLCCAHHSRTLSRTSFENLYIKSVVEKTSSRRVLRKLLEVSVEVEFAIRVQDAAAQAAMIANDGLTERKLNYELAKQVFPASADLSRRQCFLCLRCAGERR
jgi:hypothetical protein